MLQRKQASVLTNGSGSVQSGTPLGPMPPRQGNGDPRPGGQDGAQPWRAGPARAPGGDPPARGSLWGLPSGCLIPSARWGRTAAHAAAGLTAARLPPQPLGLPAPRPSAPPASASASCASRCRMRSNHLSYKTAAGRKGAAPRQASVVQTAGVACKGASVKGTKAWDSCSCHLGAPSPRVTRKPYEGACIPRRKCCAA
jgi:hypothetical protein